MAKPCDTLRYAARAGALLSYYKVLDDVSDGKGMKKFLSLCLLPEAKRMRKKAGLSALESSVEASLGILHEQEKAGCSSPDAMADIFGRLMGEVFAAQLPEDETRRIAYACGYHTGRWIYLLDAADDFESDRKNGSYNPFMAGDNPAVSFDEIRDRVQTALTMELTGLESAVNLITFRDAGLESILKNILYLGMRSRELKITQAQPANTN